MNCSHRTAGGLVKTIFISGRCLFHFIVLLAIGVLAGPAMGQHVNLQNATADNTQNTFVVGALTDGLYPTSNTGADGWAGATGGGVGGTPSLTSVFETTSDLDFSDGGTIRVNTFSGWSSSHTLGSFRYSYTTDDRSTFADGLNSGGDITANWVQITPLSATATNGVTLAIQGDNSVLSGGADPNRTTTTVTANLGPIASGITGFRLEALENGALPSSGPGRAGNGNWVARELDVSAFAGKQQVGLQNATALRSQTNFSVDNAIDGQFPHIDVVGVGWANNGEGDNVAVFETTAPISVHPFGSNLTAELFAGGFTASHTLASFRISATTADQSLFADGADNSGLIGPDEIWTVLDPISIVSDNPTSTFTINPDGSILAGGTPGQYELYTIDFATNLTDITGFRLEAFEDPSLPFNGPGFASGNGNFVVREFSVFQSALAPEPASIAIWSLIGMALAGFGCYRARRNK